MYDSGDNGEQNTGMMKMGRKEDAKYLK